jgi:hypothetical protein
MEVATIASGGFGVAADANGAAASTGRTAARPGRNLTNLQAVVGRVLVAAVDDERGLEGFGCNLPEGFVVVVGVAVGD